MSSVIKILNMNQRNSVNRLALDFNLVNSAGRVQHAAALGKPPKSGAPRVLYVVYEADFPSAEEFLPLLEECTNLIIDQMGSNGSISKKTVWELCFNWVYDSSIEQSEIMAAISTWTLVYVMKWDETYNVDTKEDAIQSRLQNQYIKEIMHSNIYLYTAKTSSANVWNERRPDELLFFRNYWTNPDIRKGRGKETQFNQFVSQLIRLFQFRNGLKQQRKSWRQYVLEQSPIILDVMKDLVKDTMTATGPMLLFHTLFSGSRQSNVFTPEYEESYGIESLRAAIKQYTCPYNSEGKTMCTKEELIPWNDVIFRSKYGKPFYT